MREGVAFERGIVDAARSIVMPLGGETELTGQDFTIPVVRTFENRSLGLIGKPDGLVTANGALQPIEIKSHRLLKRSDRMELSFYWLLLSAERTDDTAEPTGWIFLREGGSYTCDMVKLTSELLDETRSVIEQVRRVRRDGVEPRLCRCTVCNGLRRQQVREHVLTRRDLSAISGVGRTTQQALFAAGFANWDDLLQRDAHDISCTVSRHLTKPISSRQVRRWQLHAQALMADQILWMEDAKPFPLPDQYIVFDAEYTADNIWLLGVRVIQIGGDLCFSLWASPAGEAQALSDFAAIMQLFHALPVITWGGASADLPALRKAAARSGDDRIVELIGTRHVDLYLWTRRNLFLPIPTLALKDAAMYCGMSRESSVMSGLQAELLWSRYQQTGDQDIKTTLVDYNLDDLRSLVHVAEFLRTQGVDHCGEMARERRVLQTTIVECEPDGPPASEPSSARFAHRVPIRGPQRPLADPVSNRNSSTRLDALRLPLRRGFRYRDDINVLNER